MKDNSLIIISRGPTMQYVVYGVIIFLLAAFIGYSYHLLASLPLLYCGVVLFISKKGVIIDVENYKIKAYFDLFFTKTGNWVPLDRYNKLALSLFRENQTLNMLSISTTVKTKTYDVYLLGKSNERLDINDYSDYNEAKETLFQLSKTLKIPAEDRYQIILEKLAKRRKER